MEKYIGTRIIEAEPCKAWKKTGKFEIGADGYKVKYPYGLTSWSPKGAFEGIYRPMKGVMVGMTFGYALEAIKQGFKVARDGWAGNDVFVVYQKGYPDGIAVNKQTAEAYGVKEGTVMKFRPYMQLKTAQNDCVMWAPSVSDALAEDWYVVED